MNSIRVLLGIGISIVSAFLAIDSGFADDRRPMTLIDLINVPILSNPRLAPDGSQLIFRLSEADWKANKYISHIWRINDDGTGSVKMTSGEQGESSPRWSPDGRQIAFLAKRGESKETQIYLISNQGGEANRLTEHKTNVLDPQWSPDGSAIYFRASDPKTKEEKERDKAKDDIKPFEEDAKQVHLWKIVLEDKIETKLTDGEFSVIGYELSRDGRRIAMHRAPSPRFGDQEQGEVWVTDADGTNGKQLTANRVPESGAALSPDNATVLFTASANETFDFYYNRNLFTVSAAGGESELHLPELPYEVEQAKWSQDGTVIFLVANMGVRSELFTYKLATKELRRLTTGRHSVRSWHYSSTANQHAISLDHPNNPGDVWTLAADGGNLVRTTQVYEDLEATYQLPPQRKISWKGADGVTVEGLLITPFDYHDGDRVPLVVQTHGGPASSDNFGFGGGATRYLPVLTAHGYAVLKPNYRGSTGYGDDFMRDMVGGYYTNAHKDVMLGVDRVIEMGVADANKMVKMGWSAGGHMTNKIITFTDRFKAASSGAGAVNWVSMYAQSDVRTYRTPWFGGTPWQKDAPIDVYWHHSPLSEIANAKTPTVILVGEKDVRVPAAQSIELYRALKSNGVQTKLYIAPREPHGFRELRHILFKMNVELEWFARHALQKDYTWEKAPEKGDGNVGH